MVTIFLTGPRSEQLQKFFDREPALFDDRVKQRTRQVAAFMDRYSRCSRSVGTMYQAVVAARRSDDFEAAALKSTDHVR